MGKYKSISNNKLAGGLLLGAVASGSLALAALSGAGTANAGCVSISGTTFASGGGGVCVTSALPGNLAVANGAGTFAEAVNGPGNLAVAAGTTTSSLLTSAAAIANGGGNFALAHGNPGNNNGATFKVPPLTGLFDIPASTTQATDAEATGVLNRAIAIGDGSTAQAFNFDSPSSTPGNNTAFTQGLGSNSLAISGNALTPPIAAGQIANAIGNNKISLNTP